MANTIQQPSTDLTVLNLPESAEIYLKAVTDEDNVPTITTSDLVTNTGQSPLLPVGTRDVVETLLNNGSTIVTPGVSVGYANLTFRAYIDGGNAKIQELITAQKDSSGNAQRVLGCAFGRDGYGYTFSCYVITVEEYDQQDFYYNITIHPFGVTRISPSTSG